MLSVIICLILVVGATAVNVFLYCAVIKRARLVQELNEINRQKMEINASQRKQICEHICRFKHYREDLESLEWQCEACPLNTMG